MHEVLAALQRVSRAPKAWGLEDTEENDHMVEINDHVDLRQFAETMARVFTLDDDDHEDE